jgi:hypothetical protein
MKILKILLIVLIASPVLVSCRDDDEKNPATLQAKWELRQYGKISSTGTQTLADVVNPSGCANDNFALLADGTTRCLKFGKDGNDQCVETSFVAGTWSKSGKTFTMVFPGPYQRVYEVLELTTTTLKIKFLEDSPKKQADDADNLWVYTRIE